MSAARIYAKAAMREKGISGANDAEYDTVLRMVESAYNAGRISGLADARAIVADFWPKDPPSFSVAARHREGETQ